MTLARESQLPAARKSDATLLVVEDEPRLREMLVRFATSCGLSATPARSGEEAVRLTEAGTFDVVLLDLNLPGMSGMECFERLRTSLPHAGVVVLTGFADVDAARSAIRLGVSDFLTKPCDLGELEVALDRALRTRARSNAPTPVDDRTGTTLAAVERRHILSVLARHNDNRARAAAELGISLRTLYYRLEEYQVQDLRDGA